MGNLKHNICSVLSCRMLFFWGMTIDTISCMCIVLIVGLCVDYSVHIAHAFNVAEGQ